ncbi:MAG: hypothetical protein WBD53_07250, partial [Xanthobacteraceae bacterium]
MRDAIVMMFMRDLPITFLGNAAVGMVNEWLPGRWRHEIRTSSESKTSQRARRAGGAARRESIRQSAPDYDPLNLNRIMVFDGHDLFWKTGIHFSGSCSSFGGTRRLRIGRPADANALRVPGRLVGKILHAFGNDLRKLHHRLAKRSIFDNLALNAVAIGPQFFPQGAQFADEIVNLKGRASGNPPQQAAEIARG